jgi:hypothetical protein
VLATAPFPASTRIPVRLVTALPPQRVAETPQPQRRRWNGVLCHLAQPHLGIASAPAFVCEPEGNGCAERFIRTLKENLLWLTTFDTVEELRLALHAFQRQYNETWLMGRHGYKTPAQVRYEQRCALAEAASF